MSCDFVLKMRTDAGGGRLVEINDTGRWYEMVQVTFRDLDVYRIGYMGGIRKSTPEQCAVYEGWTFGDDECIDEKDGAIIREGTAVYRWFLCDGKLYRVWYSATGADGKEIPLDEVDYDGPEFLTLEDDDPFSDPWAE